MLSAGVPPPSPSSQVMKMTVEPCRYPALLRMAGRALDSHLLPSATVPLFMSSIRFGVMKEKAGSWLCARSLASRE